MNERRAEPATLSDALALLETMSPGATEALSESFVAVSLRALETRILSDQQLRVLALYWNAQAGRSDQIIRERLIALTGHEPSAALLAYVKSCIRSKSSREGRKSPNVGADIVREVLTRTLEATATRELRCAGCGYHFAASDVGQSRRELIEDLDPVYAKTPHPGRLADPLKPRFDKLKSFTSLTLDHMTPEAGFGWTDADNTTVLCNFCNQSKLIYRTAIEPISTIVAASLQACPMVRADSLPRRVGIWAAISSVGRCEKCGRGPRETELSVVLPDEQTGSRWLVPWSVEVRCYDCIVELDADK